MDWFLYFLFTALFFVFRVFRLKAKTEQDRIGSTPIVMSIIGFFAIFEFIFADSLLKLPLFHLFGLLVSILYSLVIFTYLRSLKRDVDSIFNKLVRQSQGKVSVLTFMQRTHMTKSEALDYLDDKLNQLPGITYETSGNIYYEFEQW